MENNFVWDEDKLNKLRKLWDDGLPITKIGNEIGVSRNAIAGKAHRMGLPKRNSPFLSQEILEKIRKLIIQIIAGSYL